MYPYWITFEDGSKGTCEGQNAADARARAEALTGKTVQDAQVLPYPASPVIWQSGTCPPFCCSPERCKGRTSCPKSYACCE